VLNFHRRLEASHGVHSGLYYPTSIFLTRLAENGRSLLGEYTNHRTASIRRPYSSRTARELEEAQVLSAFNVDPDMEIMERLAEKAGAYLESPEFERIMRENGINEYALIHPEKLPAGFENSSRSTQTSCLT